MSAERNGAPKARPSGSPSGAADTSPVHPLSDPLTSGSEPIAHEATPPPLVRILEALLFVGGPSLSTGRAAEIIRGLTEKELHSAVDSLNAEYRRQRRPYVVAQAQGGFVLTLRPNFQRIMRQLHTDNRSSRLSPAAIDVLALVAYRQPVTARELDAVRGVRSDAVLRQLVRKGMITIERRGDKHPREVCYGTSARFLEFFDLKSLDDLPQTQDVQRL